jgi:hypothetical protein
MSILVLSITLGVDGYILPFFEHWFTIALALGVERPFTKELKVDNDYVNHLQQVFHFQINLLFKFFLSMLML